MIGGTRFEHRSDRKGIPQTARPCVYRQLDTQLHEDGGIHEAIADYEDAVFFDILAEELARRDLGEDCDDLAALTARMDEYMDEFEANGVENLTLDV